MVNAILTMLIVGAILGAILGISSKIFYVKEDSRVEDVTALLPGYNCGGCGYPGCSGFAAALVNKEADVILCKPSKPEQRTAITEYLANN
ncbi:MAG: electron transporter RnfB [Erysipelotrichaceae bacterium]|nr:electron transporter RnfB [Erysipelotrichaceae bacterium]